MNLIQFTIGDWSQDGHNPLADKLNDMAKTGWDVEGMDVIGANRTKMLIVASKDVELPCSGYYHHCRCTDCLAEWEEFNKWKEKREIEDEESS